MSEEFNILDYLVNKKKIDLPGLFRSRSDLSAGYLQVVRSNGNYWEAADTVAQNSIIGALAKKFGSELIGNIQMGSLPTQQEIQDLISVAEDGEDEKVTLNRDMCITGVQNSILDDGLIIPSVRLLRSIQHEGINIILNGLLREAGENGIERFLDESVTVHRVKLLCGLVQYDEFVSRQETENENDEYIQNLNSELQTEYLKDLFKKYIENFVLYKSDEKKLELNITLENNKILISDEK